MCVSNTNNPSVIKFNAMLWFFFFFGFFRRECPKCKKSFMADDGCNLIKCSCNAMMCNLCKQPVEGYEHFEIADGGYYGNTKRSNGK